MPENEQSVSKTVRTSGDEQNQDALNKMGDDSLDSLFAMLPEGTRIIIDGGRVTFENLTGDMLDVALSLNPDDPDLKARK